MEEIMHYKGVILPLDKIDYTNEEMVEAQTSIRRDYAELWADKGDNESLVQAGVLHGEVNEITRRFVNGKDSNTGTHLPFLKGHLANKIADGLVATGWSCDAAIKRGRGLAEAITPIADVETDLDKAKLKSDLFDIAAAFLIVISKMK